MEITKDMMEININDIRTNPHQARKYFDEGKLKILEESIREKGLNNPLQLIWTDKDYEGKLDRKTATLVDGERRWRAMKNIGIRKLKFGEDYVLVRAIDIDEDLEIRGLIANCMREDLTPVEKAKAFMKLLRRRDIKDFNIAKCTVNRAKEFIDNAFIAEPSAHNYFVSKDKVKKVARDMKIIGLSGTNAMAMLNLLKLPHDIQRQIVFAPPNSRTFREKTKLSRQGKLIVRAENDALGLKIPATFGKELGRLSNEQLMRFFLKEAKKHGWTARKLHIMINDFQKSLLTAEEFIKRYRSNVAKISNGTIKEAERQVGHLITRMDSFTSLLSSYRTINLYAMSDLFKQKMFVISGVALRNEARKFEETLDQLLLNCKQLLKQKEEKRIDLKKLPFRVRLSTSPHSLRKSYRFSIPKEVGDAFDIQVGDEVEMQITAVFRKNTIEVPMRKNSEILTVTATV